MNGYAHVLQRAVAMAALGVLLTGEVAAQSGVENPHGPLDDACEICHTAEGWSVQPESTDFDHDTTGFTLDGAHRVLSCTDCHADLEFGTADPTCSGCHVDVHRGELGRDCAFCHSTHSFLDQAEIRRMHRQTRFALTGRHAGIDCESCHLPQAEGGLTYLGVSVECVDCHRAAFEGATSPDHVTSGFTERCDFCHGTAAWEGGFFNHERQLGGGRLVCVECHRDDYDGADDPDHVSLNFPLDCSACHDTRRWDGADFAHDDLWFPIDTGRHAGEWDACSDCHAVSTDYGVFDCLGCHPHSDRAKTDGDHREEAEYSYDSTSCYDCHPRGRSKN